MIFIQFLFFKAHSLIKNIFFHVQIIDKNYEMTL